MIAIDFIGGWNFLFALLSIYIEQDNAGQTMSNNSDTVNSEISHIIEMAWCDKTSFDQIKKQTGMPEKEVIKLMRKNLKPGSFRVWRERVSGRKAKHQAKL